MSRSFYVVAIVVLSTATVLFFVVIPTRQWDEGHPVPLIWAGFLILGWPMFAFLAVVRLAREALRRRGRRS